MYLINDKLHTIFTLRDGTTAGYTTTTRIKGPTGDTYNLVDGGSTSGLIGTGGATFPKGRNSANDLNVTIIKSIEVTGDNGGSAISLVQDETLDTINIHFDRGNFGYLDIGLGSGQNQIVGTDSNALNNLWFVGITGTTYDIGTSLGLDNGAYAINTRVQDYKEKVKYLTVGAAGSGSDLENYNEGANESPMYAPPINTPINPNRAKTFVLDMRQFENVDADGNTGGVQLRFRDAHFGYTGNGPKTSTDLGKAFTLITHGATCGYETTRFDGSNIIWPLDLEPCWSGKTDIINFFWLPCEPRDLDDDDECDKCCSGAAWHGNIIQWESQSTTISAGSTSDPFWCHAENANYSNTFKNYPLIGGITGTTGACCVGEGICVYTTNDLCHGFYLGAGTTCGTGGTGSVCYDTGACCTSNAQILLNKCYEEMTINDCIEIGNLLNNTSAFGGTGSKCKSMNCSQIEKQVGACCDGIGNCSQISKTECSRKQNFFLGVGQSCTSENNYNVCFGGTGACLKGITNCVDGISGSSCIADGYLYAGDTSVCGDTNYRNKSTTSGCIPEVAGLDLQPGDLYAGGMVVGLYRPLGSELFGSDSFGGNKYTSWQKLMEGGTGATSDREGLSCQSYRSKYDWHGYGFDSTSGCSDISRLSLSQEKLARPDAYYLIVSLNPIGITGDREIVNPNEVYGATSEFFWGNRGSSWGPLYNQITGKYDDISDDYNINIFPKSEGYWYDQNRGTESLDFIPINTFSSCRRSRRIGNGAIQKLRTKPVQTAHGLWHRNWGMYNTIRTISADNALYQGYNDDSGNYTSSDFGPGLTGSYISAFRATRLFNDNLITGTTSGISGSNPGFVSGWYVPSQDEMSFIASNCIGTHKGFDLNAKLFEENGTPFDGWYWTSTGAFNETKGFTAGLGEGVINPVGATGPAGVTADPGTLAWAMNFDGNGTAINFKVGKKNRTHNTYQVRPVRLVRCDGKFTTNTEKNYKLWKLPKVLRDKDKNINQEY
jgi:hypothetical protein